MPSNPPLTVVTQEMQDGDISYGVRFSHEGRRRYLHAGYSSDGMTEAKALAMYAAVDIGSLAKGRATGDVYVVQQPNGVGPVKIGQTRNLRERLSILRGGSPVPLEVVATWTVPDCQDAESSLHRRFAAARLHGEWFDAAHRDVAAWLTELRGAATAQ